MENKNMKLKKFLKVLCVGVMCFGTLTTLTGCKSEEDIAREKREELKKEREKNATFTEHQMSYHEFDNIPLQSKLDVKLDDKKYKVKKATQKVYNGTLNFPEKTYYEFYYDGDNIKQASFVSQVTVKEKNNRGEKFDTSDMNKVLQQYLNEKVGEGCNDEVRIAINRGSISYKAEVDGKTVKFYMKQDIAGSFKDYEEYAKEINDNLVSGEGIKVDAGSYRGVLLHFPFIGGQKAFNFKTKTVSLKKALKEIKNTNEYLG